jgi:hypothetical protein
MRRNEVQGVAIPAMDISKIGLANPCGFFQHGCKYRLQIARRTADDLQYLGRCRLLLQRFCQLSRTLLLRLKQPCVLDGDYRLICEGFDQLDLLLGERPNRCPVQKKNANR